MERSIKPESRRERSSGLGAAKTPIAAVKAKRRVDSETMIVAFDAWLLGW